MLPANFRFSTKPVWYEFHAFLRLVLEKFQDLLYLLIVLIVFLDKKIKEKK